MIPGIDPSHSYRFGSIGSQLDRLCDEFEAAWQQGATPPQIEDFLRRAPAELRDRLLLELLFLDVSYRRARGEQPATTDYKACFLSSLSSWHRSTSLAFRNHPSR
jgi:hypothetical protein